MTDPAAGISIQGVRFVYPRNGPVALDWISVDIARGETVAIIGQNGSGKTTLTKLLNGLLHPTDGRVVVLGSDTSGRSVQELAREVGYVFQNPNHQLFARSVTEELAFGPRNLGLGAIDVSIRVEEVARAFGLTEILESHPYRLGFPMRKLVSIASVVAMRPSVLVLDEPTTGQDHRTVDAIAAAIARLSEDGTTIVCVSHDMRLVVEVAERVVVMRAGHIVADGGVREVFADAATLAATGLVAPQVARLSMALPAMAGRPPALTATELVEAIRGTRFGPLAGSA